MEKTNDLLARIAAHNEVLGFNPKEIVDELTCKRSCYLVGVTGVKRAYYTLYHYPYRYCKNLSISDEKAVDKILEAAGSMPICFLPEDEMDKIVRRLKGQFPWGKYEGRLVTEIWEEDNQYCRWLLRKMKSDECTSKKNEVLLEVLRELAEADYEKKSQENREKITSEFLPEGKATDLVISIIHYSKPFVTEQGYSVKVKGTENGIYYYFYLRGETAEVLEELLSSGEVRIKSAHRRPDVEDYGIKYNYLNRVKLAC